MGVKNINGEEFCKLNQDPDKLEVIDIREPSEHEIVKIKCSKLIPMSAFEFRLDEIDWTKQVILYCRTGGRSRMMCSRLDGKKDVTNLDGGILTLYTRKCPCLEVDESMISRYFN